MPGTNSFYPYGESSTNILNNSEYQTDSERSSGAQSGAIARSKMYNKQARQAAAGAYAVGALVAKSGKNADDSSAATLATNFQAAVNYQAAHFVASDVSVSGTTATATVAELATTAAADLPALFALSLVLDQALPAGASIAIASSLPDVTLSWPIYVGSEALDSDTITGGAITLLIDTVGAKAFFKAGGGRYKPTDLPPLNPNFTMEISEGDSEDTVTVTADKLTISPTTDMLAGGQWEYGTEMSPAPGKGQNIKHWTREQLVTSDKPFDGLLLGDVTASDAVNETILWLPENSSGSVVLQPYIVLSTDYLGGVYVTAKNVNSAWQGQWGSSVVYSGSTVQSWCENTYLNSVLVKSVADQVMECSLPVSFGSVVDAKCWIPSCKELGITTAVQDSGETMPYFANNDRRVYGTGSYYWTRSTQATSNVYCITNAGVSDTQRPTNNAFYRPAFVLPKDFQIQQRPDGSYTVYNDYGLITLKDIKVSDSSTAPIRLLADGTYDLVPEDPSLSAQTVSTLAEEQSSTTVTLADIPVSSASVKTIVKIPETDGSEHEYLYLSSDYEGTGRALLRRVVALDETGTIDHDYESAGTLKGIIDNWVDSAFPSWIGTSVIPVSVPYSRKASNSASINIGSFEARAFPLSYKEIGGSTSLDTGTPLPYFSNDSRRIVHGSSGSPVNYWTRDFYGYSLDTNYADYYVNTNGQPAAGNGNYYAVPAITLPLSMFAIANDDGTFSLTEDTGPVVSFSFTVPHGTQPVVRQYTYNYEEHYQTMLEGGVLPALGGDTGPTYSEVLAENTWAQIAQAVADKDPILDVWQVGDTKDEVIAGETLTFAIMGKNMDDLADGSGKAGLTFGMTQLMASTRQMNSSNTNAGSFAGSAMYSWLSGTIYPNLTAELKDAIKAVNKKTSSGGGSSVIRTDAMYLWLFSEIEVFGKTTYSYAGEGTQYPYFATSAERIKRLSNGAGAASDWWERSPRRNYGDRHFCLVDASGIPNAGNGTHNLSRAVCFGFCI